MMIGSSRVIPHATPTPYCRMELNRVVEIASSRVAVLPGVLGFEIAPMRGDAHNREWQTQIRINPMVGSGDVEFRYCLPLGHSGCGSFDEIAWDIVGRAHEFLTQGHHARLGEMAQATIVSAMAASVRASLPPRLVAVGVSFEFAVLPPRLCADIEMLGSDLEVGIERIFGFDVEHLLREVARFVQDHEKRHETRARAVAARASGWIDQAALRLIDAAGLDRRTTIELVVREGCVHLYLLGCGSAWKKDPGSGVIGVEKRPLIPVV